MEFRTLEITVISAKDLKDVNLFTKMDVYAVVMVAGDPRSTQKTPVDKDGGTSPKWNYPMKFTVNEDAAQQNRLTLHFQLKSDRTLGDKDIGEVYVPLKELLDSNIDGKSERVVCFSVKKPSGKQKGNLNFSYKFGERFVAENMKKVDEPVMAYPANKAGTSSGYAPPPGGYYPPPAGVAYPPPHASGYPPPPVAGYAGYGYAPQGGYPPPHAAPGYGYMPPPHAAGYGYAQPPVQKPQKKKNNNLGLGLGAGLLGGLLIGDMVSDVGDMGGYDGGFDDAGGFDF